MLALGTSAPKPAVSDLENDGPYSDERLMTPTPNRRLAAILSADAVGYSRLMADDDVATIGTFHSHRELIANQIQQRGGRVVDVVGDNLLAEFPSVVTAVECALEIQQKLAVENAELPADRRMPFRIGVNLGDIVVDEQGIAGHGINVAARVQAIAEPGSIAVSGTAYDQVEGLPLDFEDVGPRHVKNIPNPIRIYRIHIRANGERAENKSILTLIGAFRSKKTVLLSAALVGLWFAAIFMAPEGRLQPVVTAGTTGFSLLFAHLFFSFGIGRIPVQQRSVVTVSVLIVLVLFMSTQGYSMVSDWTSALRKPDEISQTAEVVAKSVPVEPTVDLPSPAPNLLPLSTHKAADPGIVIREKSLPAPERVAAESTLDTSDRSVSTRGLVDYRLRNRDGDWLVIDVVIEGISMVSNYRNQFKSIVNSGGPELLLEKLREKNAEFEWAFDALAEDHVWDQKKYEADYDDLYYVD